MLADVAVDCLPQEASICLSHRLSEAVGSTAVPFLSASYVSSAFSVPSAELLALRIGSSPRRSSGLMFNA